MVKFMKRAVTLSLAVVLLMGCVAAVADMTQTTGETMEAAVPLSAFPVAEAAAQPAEGQPAAKGTPAEQPAGGLAAVASPEAPAAVSTMLVPVASGTAVKKGGAAVIDHSNTTEGYVMVQYTGSTTKRLKAQVKGPTTTYTYDLTAGAWEVFPLSDGSGSYKVTVFKNVSGTKYTAELTGTFTVELKDEFGPYRYPNQYVNYSAAPNAVAKAQELVKGKAATLEKVAAIYDYVVKGLAYDYNKAATVKSGYLPALDSVLAEKKGICFDYAALMTGMLRSQGIPCKLVVGYAGGAYHAWISVWSQENGWVDGAIFFNGTTWQRMDPTFASSGKQSAATMAYIGNGANYTAKYLY